MRSICSLPRLLSRRRPEAVIEPSGNAIAAATAKRSGVSGFNSSAGGTTRRIYRHALVFILCVMGSLQAKGQWSSKSYCHIVSFVISSGSRLKDSHGKPSTVAITSRLVRQPQPGSPEKAAASSAEISVATTLRYYCGTTHTNSSVPRSIRRLVHPGRGSEAAQAGRSCIGHETGQRGRC